MFMRLRLLAAVLYPAAILAALALAAPPAAAQTEGLRIARLKYGGGGDWYSNPTSLPNLAEQVRARTSIEVADTKEAQVELLDESLFSYPFIYMNGHGEVRFSQAEVERLRDYLDRGGFLWADDNYGMDRSFRREIAKVFPDTRLVEIPFDHPVFHAFYDLRRGTPKIHEHDGKPAQALGIFSKGRLVVLYTYQADIGDGMEDQDVHNDPPDLREDAMRFGVNLVVYAMTH
jgi:hypothetical protein